MDKPQKHPILTRIEYLKDEVEHGSLRDFLAKTGIPRNSFNMWMYRNRPPKRESLEKICLAYGVSMDWIKGDAELSAANVATTLPVEKKDDSSIVIIEELKKDKEELLTIIRSQQKTIQDLGESVKNLSTDKKIGNLADSLSYNLK